MRVLQENAGFLTRGEVVRILSTQTGEGTADEETVRRLVSEYCEGAGDAEAVGARLRKAGLFEFEVYQLLDARPQSLLTLQLVIDEMEERYSHEELEGILEMFRTQDAR